MRERAAAFRLRAAKWRDGLLVNPVDVEHSARQTPCSSSYRSFAIFLMLAIPFALLFSVAIIDEILSNRLGNLD